MQAVEFETEIKNGQLTIPDNLLPELTNYKYGKVILLLKEIGHDLSPIIINSISDNKRTLHFRPGLVLNPVLDKNDSELILVENDEFNIHAYAINRTILIEELTTELFLLWDEYAQESLEKLTPKARKLKETLLNRCHLKE